MKKSKGLTLLESVAYMALVSGVALGVYEKERDYNATIKKDMFANNINDILTGVDKRLSIDGFDYSLWDENEWTDREKVSKNLINGELRPSSSYSNKMMLMKAGGCQGKWEPQNELDEKTNLVQCNMWGGKLPLDLDVDAKLNKDANNFVQSFEMTFSFPDIKSFEKNILLLKRTHTQLNKGADEGLSGSFSHMFIDQNDDEITMNECVDIAEKCRYQTVFDRDGGIDELRVDGLNKMVNSSINFVESNNSSPLTCVRWKKSASGAWTKTSDNQACGIGIYPDTGSPLIVEVAADNGTFKNIMLEKECNLYNWDNANKKLVLDSETSPCGILDDGTEIIQVIDNLKATNTYTQNFYFKEIDVKVMDTNHIIAKNINSDFVTIQKEMNVTGKTITEFLEVDNKAVFNGQSYADNRLLVEGMATVKSKTITDQKFTVEDLDVEGDTDMVNLYGESILANDAHASTNLSTNLFEFSTSISTGDNCSTNGEMAKKSNGALMICKSGKWSAAVSGVPVGTVTAWTSYSIPSGWLKCNGSSIPSKYSELRSLVGSNTPDLRGRFVRGWIHGSSSSRDPDSGRGIRSWQAEEIRSHNHKEKRYRGSDSSGSGSKDAADNNTYNTYTGYAGIESRPKNYSVIYIIKAE